MPQIVGSSHRYMKPLKKEELNYVLYWYVFFSIPIFSFISDIVSLFEYFL